MSESEYIGDLMPRWVKSGVKVRVKKTRLLRMYGLLVNGGSRGDTKAWPGDVAEIVKVDGSGWYHFRLEFSRGRSTMLTTGALEDVIRVKADRQTAEVVS